ncbi:ribonucleoside hydrolase RihC [Texcoconibacillus texcoconensis]|uniref:Non-specific riboncleoside hydrolase n=1 Tax=Texcoconibacillus texcoconensis TaxID=1095777 RepID=A0A840QM64_9BACI|nr:ribonucleoside hydrolase RihC [Texcoconibacillus texcoconensis]MBB5172457.1 non-specific riboncleoside hydrolase [Texcoconibacillus texcoconensis]
MTKTPIIIDTDPGIDDAAAITVALNDPKIDVQLITTMAGNVPVEKTTKNALNLVEFYRKDVEVARGAAQPLLRNYEDASYYHGESGMDGYEFPHHERKESDLHAVQAMKKVFDKSEEPITLVAIGALTNVALLLMEYPEVKKKIKEMVIMGGSLSSGNVNSAAEFNIYADPHAAKIAFQSEIPIVMAGLDVTLKALLYPTSFEQLPSLGRTGNMLHGLFYHYRGGSPETGLQLHDVCTLFYILYPEKVETKDLFVEVATEGPAIGATIADLHQRQQNQTNTKVCVDIDVDFFNEWFLDSIRTIG